VDLKYDGQDCKQHLLNIARQLVRLLATRQASAETKYVVATVSTLRKVLYASKVVPWHLSDYEDFDRIFDTLLRRVSGQMRSFPSALLHLPHLAGGTGLVKFSDTAQLEKLATLHRLANGDASSAFAALGLFTRGIAKVSSHPPMLSAPVHITCPLPHLVLTSLLEWARKYDLNFTTLGHSVTAAQETPLWPLLPYPYNNRMAARGYTTLGDLRLSDEFGSAWLPQIPTLGDPPSAFFTLPQCPIAPPLTRPGQFWALPSTPNLIVEVQHMAFDGIHTRPWIPSQSDLNPLSNWSRVILTPGETQLIHTDQWYADLPEYCHRVFASLQPNGTRTIVQAVPSLSPSARLPVGNPMSSLGAQVVNRLQSTMFDHCEVYVDGSINYLPTPKETIFLLSPSRARIGIGIVFIPLQGDQPIYVSAEDTGAANSKSDPASAEMSALFLALALLREAGQTACPIYSDDQSLVKRMNRRFNYSVKEKNFHIALATHNLLAEVGSQVTYTKGHPERRRPKLHSSKWSKHDWGIHIADRLSKCQPLVGAFRGHQRPQPVSMDFWEIMRTIPLMTPIPFLSFAGYPLLTSPSNHIKHHSLQAYRSQREDSSSTLGRCRHWQGHSTEFASRAWTLPSLPIAAKGTALRIMWDKNWHGWNRVKDPSLLPDAVRFLSKCPYCGSPKENQDHWIRACPIPKFASIRKNAIHSAYKLARKSPHGTSPHACRVVNWANTHADGHWIWTGHWPASLQESFCQTIHLSPSGLRHLHRTFLAISRILTHAALSIWKARRSLPITFETRAGLDGPFAKYKRLYHHNIGAPDPPTFLAELGPAKLTQHDSSTSDSESSSPSTPSRPVGPSSLRPGGPHTLRPPAKSLRAPTHPRVGIG